MVSLKVENEGEERIVKVQFKDVGIQGVDSTAYVNHQIWLYEKSGLIQFRYGSVWLWECSSDPNVNLGPFIGLLRTNAITKKNSGIFSFKGDPSAPQISRTVPFGDLHCYPDSGIVYTISYQSASVAILPTANKFEGGSTVSNKIYLEGGVARATLYNLLGFPVKEWYETGSVLEIGELPNGIYQLRTENNRASNYSRILKIDN
jgi:hypothetical protein